MWGEAGYAFQSDGQDIKTAYLNAPIQEDIYIEQPEGYQKGKQMVCKLKRSLYGLKQSGRNWFECLSSHLLELNFKASLHDPCLLTLTRNGHKCWIVIWVDDILYGSTDSQFTSWFNDKMSERFNIGESGPLTWFLGISFNTTRRQAGSDEGSDARRRIR